VPVPVWFPILCGAIFGGTAYLMLQLAPLLYGKVAPLADGPRPMAVRTFVPVAAATILGAAFAYRGSDLPELAFLDTIVAALCAMIWTDLTRGIIGDWFTLPPIALALIVATFRGDVLSVALGAAFVTAPFAVAAFASKGMGFGWGDVKLVALGALLLGPQTSLMVFAATSLLACAVAVAAKRRTEPIAFAPYLALAIAAGLLFPGARSFG
jgi:Flp pilus assembly protein protease CpaA